MPHSPVLRDGAGGGLLRLTRRIKEVLDLIGCYVMENPQGGMEKMLYMANWEDKKKIVDLCAFVWPFRKTTNL